MSRRPALMGFGAATLLLLTACGGSPTAAGGGGSAGTDTATGAQALYQEVGELTGQERRDRLVELAAEEGKKLSIYTSLNADIADIILPQFEKEFDIKVDLYRADSETILQRTLQENSASFSGADIVETNATEMSILASEGITAEYKGEQRDKVNEKFQYEGWTPSRFNIFAPAWNTKTVTGDLIPTSWQDLADPKYDGILSVEVGDYDWYMTLYGHLQDEGKSDEEIDQYFSDVVQGSKVTKGHSGQIELLSAGEFGVVAASYTYLTEKARAKGAPVDDQPLVEPVIARANGAGLLSSSKRPATAMLFMDWFLEEGQQALLDNGLTPAVMPDGSDPLGAVEVVPVDVEQLLEEGEEWSARYDEVLKGGEKIEKKK
jgi:iron(III) transport system substrate-binding protein